jgi:probable rRNA maturation factor
LLKINIYNRQKALPLSPSSVKKAAVALLKFLDVSCDEISFYFVTEEKIAKLHAEHFNDPTPTDCITFPLDASYLGDLFICPAVAIKYAEKRNLDPFQETLLYMVHGLLHLLNFDDLEPKQRSSMRKKEKSCMRHLNQLRISLQPK